MTTPKKQTQQNPHLADLEIDYLYHLGLDTSMDLAAMFGDVKYVCMGGSPVRAKEFALNAARQLGIPILGNDLEPIGKTERFTLFKVGPVISTSHGMGMPSTSILLHEVAKLLRYAGCEDYKFIRIGTSGGIGVNPGDVVITSEALNGKLEPTYELIELGKTVSYPTQLNLPLAQALMKSAAGLAVTLSKTMSTDSFYEAQGRLDGALPTSYTEQDKMAFLKKAHEAGVRNIEMEAAVIAAFCLKAEIPAAIVCTAILNRLNGDQVTSTPEQLAQFSDHAQQVVINFMRDELKKTATMG